MLHAYCVRRADEPGPAAELRGLAGRPVRLLEAGELGLWVSPVDAAPASLARVREHDRVIREALRTATPLPLRFGAMFPDEAAARALLVQRREEFRSSLERLAGRVEMSVRVGGAPEDEAEPSTTARDAQAAQPAIPGSVRAASGRPGRAYLEARRAEREREVAARERARLRLAEAESLFADLALPTVLIPLAAGGLAGSLAHLVHRSELAGYREYAKQARQRRPDLHLAVSGPWAPYSFV